MSANIDRPFRSRVEAAAYVTQTYGIPCSAKSLAKIASQGRDSMGNPGPAFRKAGHFVVYSTNDLDEWVEAKLGPLVRSTSEAREAA
jgi:hypothetical protein